ncbi:MAG: phosphate/phosphite/phosphonate ABC transporter substrate-binding protein [Candidatus Dormibacteraeota bacterium]|nr:phosphate/phosphite/phosphonate ABC transporter substrate-binding protein [Candidatus Dormibacteraeota bacterium]
MDNLMLAHRRLILILTTALLVGACTAIPPAPERDLTFGFTPVLSEAEMRSEFEPLVTYLSQAIGRKVRLYIAKDYGDLRTQMESGAVDIGSFSPFAYVDATRGGKIRIIAQSILDGSATYRGLIIARRDSGLRDVKDLEGKRFAFVDAKSASGYVYPRAMLVERGVNPERYFKETIFAGGHDKVISAVLERRVDAGAIYDGALGVARAKGLPVGELSTLSSTDPIPHDAVAVRIGMDDALVRKVQSALVDLERSPAGKPVIANSKKKLTGHVVADDGLFDVVRRTARIAGL